jgi:hypothetical protein
MVGKLGPVGSGLAAGLGVFASAGARGASLLADEANQSGVGHQTYGPDFSGARYGQANSTHPRHPESSDDPNGGDGADDDTGTDGTPPMTPIPQIPTLPMPNSQPTGDSAGNPAGPKAPAAGSGGGATASESGAGGGAAAAGSVPPIPA